MDEKARRLHVELLAHILADLDQPPHSAQAQDAGS